MAAATVNGVKPVTGEQQELIHSLVYYQEQYEQPPDEEVRRIFNHVSTPPKGHAPRALSWTARPDECSNRSYSLRSLGRTTTPTAATGPER